MDTPVTPQPATLNIDIPKVVTPSQLLSMHFDNMDNNRRLTDTNIIRICGIFGGIDEVLNILLSAHAHDLDAASLNLLSMILQSTKDDTPEISQVAEIITPNVMSLQKTTSSEDDPEVFAQSVTRRYNTADEEALAELYRLALQNREHAPSIISVTHTATRVKRSGTIRDQEQPIEWRYCFSRNNTFIHSIFGEIIGQKIFNVLYSKYVVFFIFMLACSLPISFQNMKYSNDIVRYIYVGIAVPIQILYFIFHLLSVNKKCASIIVTRFEFWLKLFYGIQFCIGTFLYWNISTGIAICLGIITLISIMLLSLSDGLQFKTSMKIAFGVTASTYYTIVAGYYFLYHNYNETTLADDMIWELGHDISISLITVLTQSSQILALFFWRTTILSIVQKKKCTLITYSPFLKWERDASRCGSSLVFE